MIDLHTYYLFLAMAVVLVLTPGPDTVLVLSRTLANGRAAGLMTLLGTQVGNLIHAILVGIGVSTIILLFPAAFSILKIAGVAYLLYLAVLTWRSSASVNLTDHIEKTGSFSQFFRQGLINNLTNPKMIAFFLAMFPQFVRPGHGSLAMQSLILGLTLSLMAIAWIGFIVVLVSHFRTVVARSTLFFKMANRLAAATFVGLAYRLAMEENR